MKIKILNECFLKESHLQKLRKLGEVSTYTDTDSEEKAVSRLQDADIAIVDMYLTPINEKVLGSASKLKFISINSTGFDLVDLKSAKAKDVTVSNVPDFSTEAVAEHTIALMLATIRKIPFGNNEMRQNPFEVDPAIKRDLRYKGWDIKGKTLGIVGLGKIGIRVAQLGKALGMNVIAYNRTPKKVPGVKLKSLHEVLSESDVVSIHLSLNTETENIIGKKELQLMKPHAVLINAGRGKHIDTKALYEVLKENKIGGAGLDVLAEFSKDNPLLTLENIVLTPHVAWFTDEALENMASIIVKNVEAFVKGKPQNVVS